MTKRSITLSEGQHRALESLTKKGVAPANQIRHAQILLHIDRGPKGPGWSTAQIIEAFTVSRSTVERVRKRFLEQGLDAALVRRPQPARPTSGNWMAKPKPTWSRCCVDRSQRKLSGGACGW